MKRRHLDRLRPLRAGRRGARRRLARRRRPARPRRLEGRAWPRSRRSSSRTATRRSPTPRAATARRRATSSSPARARPPTSSAMGDFFRGLPEVSNTNIGAWGISYGGGQTWNGLADGHRLQGSRGRRDVDRPLQRALAAGRREVGDRARVRQGGRGALAADHRRTRTTPIHSTESSGESRRSSHRAPRSREHLHRSRRRPTCSRAASTTPSTSRRRSTATRASARRSTSTSASSGTRRRPSRDPTSPTCMSQGVAWFDHYLKGAPNGIDKSQARDDRRRDGIEAHVLRRAARRRRSSRAGFRGTRLRRTGPEVRAGARDVRRLAAQGAGAEGRATTRASWRRCSPATA